VSSNYPPGVTGAEPQISGFAAWEAWAESVKPGDRCRAYGALATVKRVGEGGLYVIVDRMTEGQWVEWEDLEPAEAACRHE